MRYMLSGLFFCLILSIGARCYALPTGFVYLSEVDKTIIQDIRYPTSENFVGRPIKGYEAPKCILTKSTANALAAVQKSLKPKHLSLKVFDCYRPQTAVNDFIVWSKIIEDQKMKQDYYPRVDKRDFFKLGYVAMQSGHTRGSTVDLTIVDLRKKGQPELNMGTHFDFMDETSHPDANVTKLARKNRNFLQQVMAKHGFKPLDTEWWHFTLKDEPFPDTYFIFPVR